MGAEFYCRQIFTAQKPMFSIGYNDNIIYIHLYHYFSYCQKYHFHYYNIALLGYPSVVILCWFG